MTPSPWCTETWAHQSRLGDPSRYIDTVRHQSPASALRLSIAAIHEGKNKGTRAGERVSARLTEEEG